MEKKVVLVGTSHIAKQSIVRVRKAIEEVKPQIVGIELDIDRFQSLINQENERIRDEADKKLNKSEKKSKKKNSNSSAYQIKQVGLKGFVFASIASYGMQKLGKFIGTNPGSDMLSAALVAKKHKIKVALIDQHVNVTLRKFSKAFSMREVGRIFGDFVFGIFRPKKQLAKYGIKEFDLNSVPDDELVENMTNYMKVRYPNMHNVLVHQRNVYMVKKIMNIMKSEDVTSMVVVVGAGHKKGMIKLLEDQPGALFDVESR